MAASRTTFEKLQRDRAKKAKAEAKRQKRQQGQQEGDRPETVARPVPAGDKPLKPEELLQLVEDAHRDLQADRITHEEFEERKNEILSRLDLQ